MRPVKKGVSPQKFTDYSEARPYLVKRLGNYCSYCERQVNNLLAVEHILPKDHHHNLELEWDNFLLTCVNCNSTKGSNDLRLDDYYWPDRDNTARAFNYLDAGIYDGIIQINGDLNDEQKIRAQQTLKLTGLDRIPGHPNLSSSDLRWLQRQQAWGKAQHSLERLHQRDSLEMREQIVESAQANGFWSIWMAVFANDLEMLHRFVEVFSGTCRDCFDPEFRPVSRPGGAL